MKEEELLTPDMLSKIDDAELLVHLAMEGMQAGRHRSITRGYGGEFEQYRDYVPGDDTKYVDWKLFARQERLYTKVYREETEMRVAILVDASGSMGYCGSSACCSKYRYAACLATCLAHLARKRGDSIGVFAHGDGHLLRSLSRDIGWSLNRLLADLTARAPSGTADCSAALVSAEAFLKGRGMVILISDFHEEEEILEERLKRLRLLHQECMVIQVLDDDEVELPFAGCINYIDSETGKAIPVTGTEMSEDYRRDMDQFLNKIKESGLSAQADVLQVRTSQDLGTVLRDFLHHCQEF